MPRTRTYPRFCHPEDFEQDDGKKNHGTTVYVRCLECGGAAWFDASTRSGQCYVCSKVHKLHRDYLNKTKWSDDAILDAIGVRLPAYRSQVSHEPETIHPHPLSLHALRYIQSRGISQKTILLSAGIQEVEHWGKKWLCWQNVAGSYELREIFGSERAMPRGSTKTYSRFDLRPGKRFVVGEGLFSVLSYAQLTDYAADGYIVLNSTSCVKALIQDMPTWEVEHVTLAVDCDDAGMKAKRELYLALSPTIEVTVDHPMEVGTDWNDVLMGRAHGNR
jgi:hypothetical protein